MTLHETQHPTKTNAHDSSGFVLGTLLGGIVGALVGLAYAPQKGDKTREQIKNAVEPALNNLAPLIKKAQETARPIIEEVRKDIEKTSNETRKKVVASVNTISDEAPVSRNFLKPLKKRFFKTKKVK